VQICESWRDPAQGGKPRTRIVAYVGQLDRFRPQDVDSIIQGLLRVFGRPSAKDTEVVEGKDFGHIYALEEIWKKVGLCEILSRHAAQSGHEFDLAGHVKLMVFNRLCDPCSKLSLLEWAQGVHVPGLDTSKLEYHHLLRAMDWLLELTSEGLTVTADEEARRFENRIDGKLIVETSCGQLGAEELILRYKELANIEQAFRTLKSSLKIRPVYPWTQRRIRAHVFLCLLALQVHRFMRTKLARSALSVERSLERLKTVKAGTLRVQAQQVPYLTALTETHKELYEQLELPFPKVKDLSQGAL